MSNLEALSQLLNNTRGTIAGRPGSQSEVSALEWSIFRCWGGNYSKLPTAVHPGNGLRSFSISFYKSNKISRDPSDITQWKTILFQSVTFSGPHGRCSSRQVPLGLLFLVRGSLGHLRIWFWNWPNGSILHWVNFHSKLLNKYKCGLRKDKKQYLMEVNSLKKVHGESVTEFTTHFCKFYHQIPEVVNPSEPTAMIA